ncbi:hypothetical protein BgiBS90_003356, partial [Biomphalaria glabrata]
SIMFDCVLRSNIPLDIAQYLIRDKHDLLRKSEKLRSGQVRGEICVLKLRSGQVRGEICILKLRSGQVRGEICILEQQSETLLRSDLITVCQDVALELKQRLEQCTVL